MHVVPFTVKESFAYVYIEEAMWILKTCHSPRGDKVVLNDSLLQTDESVEFRTYLDTAYIPALGAE